jgi:hypothetical protein
VAEGLRASGPLPVLLKLFDQIKDIHPVARADKTIDARHCLDKLSGAALRVTSGSDDTLSGPPILNQLLQYSTRLIPRRLDESAGVDNQQVSLGGVDG